MLIEMIIPLILDILSQLLFRSYLSSCTEIIDKIRFIYRTRLFRYFLEYEPLTRLWMQHVTKGSSKD